MLIDSTNYRMGNKAIASVLLLYYHLIREDGFTNDQTVYIDTQDFDGFSFLDIEIDDSYCEEIDELLLREGAIVFLICDLNDLIEECSDSYLLDKLMVRVIDAYEKGKLSAIPETADLINLINTPSYDFDYDKYKSILEGIYQKYILNKCYRMIETSKQA